jgi:hypothetical protein
MKNFLIVVLFLLSAFAITPAKAQSNAIKINILSPIFRTINLSYERALSETSSFQLGVFFTGASVGDFKYSGFGITPEYRFYLSATEAPQGVYVAPFLRYQGVKIEEETTASEADFTAFGGGVVIGKQWIFKERITLDIFLGPSFNSGKVKVKSGDEDEFDNLSGGFDGFGLRTGITLGVAF